MKKTFTNIIAFLSVFLPFNLFGNDYEPLVQEGAWWLTRYYSFASSDFPQTRENRYYEIKGDTMINNVAYKKLMYSSFQNPNYSETVMVEHTNPVGYMREEDKKVYYLSWVSGEEEMLVYDFNLTVGGHIYPLNYIETPLINSTAFVLECYYTINPDISYVMECGYDYVEIDTNVIFQQIDDFFPVYEVSEYELLDGSIVKRYNEEGCCTVGYAERIGSFTKGIFPIPYGINEMYYFGLYVEERMWLKGFGVNNQVLYSTSTLETNEKDEFIDILLSNENVNPIKVNIFPNPTSNFIKIDAKVDVNEIDVYDLNGALVNTFSSVNSIDVSHLNSGKYLVRFELIDGTIGADVFIKL